MERLLQFLLSENTGKRVGALAGLIIGLSIVIFGFWSTVFLGVCVVVGGLIGKAMDNHYTGLDGFKQMFHKKEQ